MHWLPPPSQSATQGGYGSVGYGYAWRAAEAQKNLLRTHTTAVSSRMLHALAADGFKPVKYFSIDRVFRCVLAISFYSFAHFVLQERPSGCSAAARGGGACARAQNTHLLALEPPIATKTNAATSPSTAPTWRSFTRRAPTPPPPRDAGAEGGQRSRFFFVPRGPSRA